MKGIIKKYEEFLKEKGIQEEKNTPAIMSAVQQAIREILIDSEKMKGRKMMDNEKGILITMKIGENEMRGFVSQVSDKEVSNEESLEFYNSTFEGYEQRLSLVASRVYTKLEKIVKKEEIRTVAEILKALATAPDF
ncbi:hypothetical protein [Enterococcus mundtii]|uniref:Uncharacterized protein n=1 Tax=Enterococcus mundtii TaxID=53346 RepID=A0A2S7RUG9_ENTMU|nr:hypothetical protein [Enterococcus mundtii]MBO1087054.1 hypothetical protein [Enterococcus mundtii]PQF23395.1 hypothetical protein CUS89_07450 [Enterococcus mundtii]